MNQINVLGIDLKIYSAKEALSLTESYMQEGPLKTVMYIDTKMLIMAGKNDEYKEYLLGCDLTVIDDIGILKTMPQGLERMIEDVEEEKYTRILLKKLAYGHKKIALLTETKEDMAVLESNLTSCRDDLQIVSKVTMDALHNSTERMLNVINDVVPDVIISKMEMFKLARLMEESRSMMNCKLWIGLPERQILFKESLVRRIKNRVFHRSFRKEVEKFNLKEEER